MPDIRIKHVIYTRVEHPYSPNNISGYQIVYQSPSLGSETSEIERHLQCFQPNGQLIERYQFFWTQKDQAVLTRSVPLFKPDREIIDRDQRDAFLAHALVLKREDFAQVRNDPFAIFEAAEHSQLFARNEQHVLMYRKQAPPELLTAAIRQKQADNALSKWPKNEMQRLYQLGLQAPTMVQQKLSLLMLTTNPDEVYMLLSALLMLLLPYERAGCTFDTFVDGCLPSAGTFWAMGSARQVNNPGFLPIDLAERQVHIKRESDDSADPKVRAYSAWLLHTLQSGTVFEEFNEEVFSAQLIAEAFLEKKALQAAHLNSRALRHFYEANAQSIHHVLLQIFARYFDEYLAAKILPVFLKSLLLQETLSTAAQATFAKDKLAWILYYWLLNEPAEFEYWEEMLKFAEQAAYPPLLLMASLKARSKVPFLNYEKLQEKAIGALIAEKKLVAVLHELLSQERASLMTQTQSSRAPSVGFALSDAECLALISALLQNNAGEALDNLFVQRVSLFQNKRALRALAKTIKKVPHVPSEFIKAVEQQ